MTLFRRDRHVEPDLQRECVAGARVDFLSAPVAFDTIRAKKVSLRSLTTMWLHVPNSVMTDLSRSGQRALDVYFLSLTRTSASKGPIKIGR